MAQRTRILFLVSHLGGGGAEHVMALVARTISREKYDVHLGVVAARDMSGVALPPWVTVHVLGAGRARAAAFKLLRLVWRIRPRVILTGSIEVSFLALLLRIYFPRGVSVLVRQNGTVSSALAYGDVPRSTRLLFRTLYRRADRIICQTRAMAEDLMRELQLPPARNPARIVVRANPVDLDGIKAGIEARIRAGIDAERNVPPLWSGEGPHLLAVGRLSREKGFDLLLAALRRVRRQFPGADLTIVGAGAEEAALRELRRSLGLQAAVRFAGYVEPPYAFFAGASMFVLPSRYEAMPNALLEAAAAGLPLVATPASGGVVELLRAQPGAWLAADVSAEALAVAIVTALDALRPGMRFSHGFLPLERDSAGVLSGQNASS
jgi:glycosyltransferase involved in cell wall biosynthesis